MRVKRPGVRVRARTGYLAATRGDEAKAKAAATAVATAKPVDARAEAVKGSLSTLGIFSRERPLRMHVATGYLPSGAATIWGVAEVPAATGQHDWSEGGQADAMLIDSSGKTILTEKLTIAPGARSLRFALGSRATLAPGDYQVQLRAKGTAAPLGAMESVRVSIAAAPVANGAVVLRRSVTTGNQPMPTADLRFRRTERIIVEVPTTATDAGTAQLLNRAGQAMTIPVTAAIRNDADGSRWRTAQLALAPLARGRLRHRTDCRHGNHAHRLSRAAVIRLRILIIIALVACPEWAAAQDKWFAADKAQHFGAGAAAAGAGYAVAVPLTRRTGWRITIGTSVGIAAGGRERAARSQTRQGVLARFRLDRRRSHDRHSCRMGHR